MPIVYCSEHSHRGSCSARGSADQQSGEIVAGTRGIRSTELAEFPPAAPVRPYGGRREGQGGVAANCRPHYSVLHSSSRPRAWRPLDMVVGGSACMRGGKLPQWLPWSHPVHQHETPTLSRIFPSRLRVARWLLPHVRAWADVALRVTDAALMIRRRRHRSSTHYSGIAAAGLGGTTTQSQGCQGCFADKETPARLQRRPSAALSPSREHKQRCHRARPRSPPTTHGTSGLALGQSFPAPIALI